MSNIKLCHFHKRFEKKLYYQTDLDDLWPVNIIIGPRNYGQNIIHRARAIKAIRYQKR